MAPYLVQDSLNNTVGACLLGLVGASIMYGVTNIQIYTYYTKYRDDRLTTKLIVFSLWILDTVHEVFVIDSVYIDLVTRFGDLVALTHPPWSTLAGVVLTGCSNLFVRMILARRLYKLTGNNWYLLVPNVLGAIMNLGSPIPLTPPLNIFVRSNIMFRYIVASLGKSSQGLLREPVLLSPHMRFSPIVFAIQAAPLDFFQWTQIDWTFYWGTAAGFLSDLWLAACLIVLFRNSRTGFRSTDSVLHVLMVYCINTTLVTTLCELATLITFALMPNTSVDYIFYLLSPKLLLNALLATYNARQDMRKLAHAQVPLVLRATEVTTGSVRFGSASSFGRVIDIEGGKDEPNRVLGEERVLPTC
ncbi:hypothetical protein CERSUDRAFT_119952 [Gelatoporia subvermispora B]|uniref:DUF6534 domain-containing protein n=1 Tax=Ceriporiopsis subvermispora (strain B) TaxID=914234 RepID=M2QXJ1_CERS8|nr:hypothetical protein CERSUDRAFT_119952 [Gelatoporia subvermispora B]